MRGVLSKALVTTLFISISIAVCGQTTEKQYSLAFDDIKFSSLLDTLATKSGYRFSYNPKEVNADTTLSVSYENKTITEILTDLRQFNIDFRINREHIILRYKLFTKSQLQIAKGNKRRVSGYITNRSNGEALIGATIYLPETGEGSMSNGYGFYSLLLNTGEVSVRVSFLGYASQEWALRVENDTLINYSLEEAVSKLEEIVIVSGSEQRYEQRMNVSGNELSPAVVRNMSGLFGEPDVIKSLQSLPGINFYSDGSTIFHVRGGNRDQNIILVDEAPVYNPAHLLGLFSVFTPGSINKIDVYKSEMPARYGGRLSSVIDVKMKEGDSKSFSLNGNTGLVASTLTLEGPVAGGNSSYLISARGSHLLWLMQEVPSVDQLHFTDFNLKFNVKTSNKNRFYFSIYTGLDKFRNRENSGNSGGITWANSAGNIRWNHIFGKSLFLNSSILFSNYDYNLFTSYESNERWNTGISLFGLKGDLLYYHSAKSTVYFGAAISEHRYSPGNFYAGANTRPLTKGVSPRDALESAVYSEYVTDLTARLKLRAGLRVTSWTNKGPATEYIYDNTGFPADTMIYGSGNSYNSFFSADPRLSLTYAHSEKSAFRGSLTVNSQFEHLVANSSSPFTTLEVWLPAGPNIKPMRSLQVALGYFYTATETGLSFDIEGFHKIMTNYLDYVDHAYMLFNPHIETELLYGRGRSLGVEATLKKNGNRFSGWLSYTYSKTSIITPEINSNQRYPALYDRPHNLTINMDYRVKKSWRVIANWTYSTGLPFTTPTGYYTYYGYQVPIYETRHNSRLPDYHRLDISTEIRLNRNPSRWEHYLNISVLNFYGRKNPFAINFNKIINEDGALRVPTDRSEIPQYQPSLSYIYGLVPSISYQFRFK